MEHRQMQHGLIRSISRETPPPHGPQTIPRLIHKCGSVTYLPGGEVPGQGKKTYETLDPLFAPACSGRRGNPG